MNLKKRLSLLLLCSIFYISQAVNAQSLIDTYNSDNNLFTQGLELNNDGQLIISTGKRGESDIGYLDINTGQFDKKASLDKKYFGEGITVSPKGIWQLTWREKTVFLRDQESFEIVDQFTFNEEGWGIAFDEDRKKLWMSDGSNILYLRNLDNFNIEKKISVTDAKNQKITKLNELEYANKYIYANMWYSNYILKINPENGKVERVFDMSDILDEMTITKEQKNKLDVLNGIAHIKDNEFYVTGKYYPVIFHVELK